MPALQAQELRLVWCPESDDKLSRRARVDQLLRRVLAPLVNLPAEALQFGREAKGRPFLRHAGAPDFNLSDTVGGTLIAVSMTGRVGVDLERIDRRPPVHRLAKRWFSAGECSVLDTLTPEQARTSFLNLWTAKEASCKATGTGIFGFLSTWQFDVLSTMPNLHGAPADAGTAERWRFLRLAPSAEHTAVIAMRDVAFQSISAYRLLPGS